MERTTESNSKYRHIEQMSTAEILKHINEEDKNVPPAVEKALPQIEKLAEAVADRMRGGGRLFYIGAGTSGRLGIVDASECPPTFGVPFDWVVGIIAGGDGAIRKAVEFAEDDAEQAWDDLKVHHVSNKDFLLGLAASGTTPYVIGGLKKAKAAGLLTGCIVCNEGSPIAQLSDFPVEVVVGPEFITGSTRMKSGTAQKLVLNMLSTAVMIRLGRVIDNKMVDMQMSNNKLLDRGVKMIVDELHITTEEATALLHVYGSVRKVLETQKKSDS